MPEYHARRIRSADEQGISTAEAFERDFGVTVEETLEDYILSLCPCPQRKSIMDFGAGIGVFAEALAMRFQNVVLAEINSAKIDHLQERFGHFANVKFLRLNNRGWPINLPDESLDFIFAREVFNVVRSEDVIRILFEFHRILHPEGYVVADFNDITGLQGEAFRSNLGRSMTHIPLIKLMADKVGLKVIRIKTDDGDYTHRDNLDYVQVAFSKIDANPKNTMGSATHPSNEAAPQTKMKVSG